MIPDDKFPELDDDSVDRDHTLKEGLNETTDLTDLSYNEETNSYELDMKGDDPDYDHPDPYNTSAPAGADFNSDWDEANRYVDNENDTDSSLENDVAKLGMHIDSGRIVELDPIDEELSKTPEDDRDDLDEEGYPKNDET